MGLLHHGLKFNGCSLMWLDKYYVCDNDSH